MKRGRNRMENRLLGGIVKQLKRYPTFLISSEDSGMLIEVLEKVRVYLN